MLTIIALVFAVPAFLLGMLFMFLPMDLNPLMMIGLTPLPLFHILILLLVLLLNTN